VSLKVDEREASTSFTVEADPELQITEADRRTRWETLERLIPLQADIYKSAKQGDAIKKQIDALQKSLEDQEGVPDAIQDNVKELAEEIGLLSYRLNRLNSEVSRLYRTVEGSPHRPTDTQRRVVSEIETRYQSERGTLDELTESKIPELERQLNENQIPRIPGAGVRR
jgi:chromosome segregation ATPase